MKNLIEKIEKIIISLKRQYQNCFEEIDCPLFTSDEIKGKISAYQDCLNLLNQYNIITAPKSIKLSEIISRLNERLKENLMDSYMKVLIKRDKTKNFITVFYKDTSYKIPSENNIFSFWNNDSIGMPEHTNFKWLYALWIAGTEIIDDLKENE